MSLSADQERLEKERTEIRETIPCLDSFAARTPILRDNPNVNAMTIFDVYLQELRKQLLHRTNTKNGPSRIPSSDLFVRQLLVAISLFTD